MLPTFLWPASVVVASITARRVARAGWRAPVPVICCGNAGVGGAGKTTLALDLGARLAAMGRAPHFLTRGHGGRARGILRVDPLVHDAAEVGDEALLLAACAPCWVGADRSATARLAVAAGAGVLVMDDGLQNPTLVQDWRLLVIDGAVGFGNGRVLPAGPLREPVLAASARATAAILIGADATGALEQLTPGLPILRARLTPGPEAADFVGASVVAFAGIGRPEKFFLMLEAAGVHVVARLAFADHHVFRPADMARVRAEAARLGAAIVTTPKDYVRLPAGWRDGISQVGVSLAWDDAPMMDQMLAGLV